MGADEPDAKRSKVEAEASEDHGEEALEEEEDKIHPLLPQLETVQEELDKINDEASDRVLQVEQEFNKQRRPVFARRNELLKKVPNFWKTTLLRHPLLSGMCTEDDEAVLGHCNEIDVEDFEDIKSGYKITLRFSADNPFFTNGSLTKNYRYTEDGALEVTGDVPTWNAGYEPVPDDEAAAGNSKRLRASGQYRDYRLFRWFVEREELEAGRHDELADIIKEDVWPNPVSYYQGKHLEDQALLGVDEDDDDDDDLDDAVMEGEEGFEGEDDGDDGEGDEDGEGEGDDQD